LVLLSRLLTHSLASWSERLALGFGLVKALVGRDNIIVFAGVRDLSRATELEALTKEFSGKLHIIKLVSADEAGNRAAIGEIKAKLKQEGWT
jgi:hypothetical protein